MVQSCSILERHCGLNGRHFSLPYSFIRGIYSVRGLAAGSQGEVEELGMICPATGGQRFALADGPRHLILNERALQWHEQKTMRDLERSFYAHQQRLTFINGPTLLGCENMDNVYILLSTRISNVPMLKMLMEIARFQLASIWLLLCTRLMREVKFSRPAATCRSSPNTHTHCQQNCVKSQMENVHLIF